MRNDLVNGLYPNTTDQTYLNVRATIETQHRDKYFLATNHLYCNKIISFLAN